MIISNLQAIESFELDAFVWHRLNLYRNVEITAKHIVKLHGLSASQHTNAKRQAQDVRACLIQAEEYFEAAKGTTLATKPLLLYYGLMSFALAEVLVKQTGDSRLAKLRETDAAHGLEFRLNGALTPSLTLEQAAGVLVSRPQRNASGPFGTFEVWRRSVREVPVPARYVVVNPDGSGSTGTTQPVALGADLAPPPMRATGVTLLEAIRALPALSAELAGEGLTCSAVRSTLRVDARLLPDGTVTGKQSIITHPTHPSNLEGLERRMRFAPSLVNDLTFREFSSGWSIDLPWYGSSPSPYFSIPDSVTMREGETHFYCEDWKFGEMGALYIALHICGNLSRYYPDKWMAEVEQSSRLSGVVERLCQVAIRRVPLLALSEIDRIYYIAKG